MATFNVWRPVSTTSVGAGYIFSPSLNYYASDQTVVVSYATTGNYNNGKAPWNVTLNLGAYDFFGNALTPLHAAASYTVPATDPGTKASFDFSYNALLLAGSETGLFWTSAANGTYAPSDQSVVNFARYDQSASGQTGSTIQLDLNGATAPVTNLYDIAIAANADFGKTFMVFYSTVDPSTFATQIKYERFNDAGAPLNGGVLASINDGSNHGISAGT